MPAIDETLSAPRVLIGFDTAGRPLLRPARHPIKLKHLLTHTAGFSYPMWNRDVGRYADATGTPPIMSGRLAALRMPLMFDPGEKWEYGINIDWVGRLVEELSGEDLNTYCRAHVCAPLGMADTGYVPTAEQQARQAAGHQRLADDSLEPQSPPPPPTLGVLRRRWRALLDCPRLPLIPARATQWRMPWRLQDLKSTTVALMGQNHIGNLQAGVMKTVMPELTNDVDLFPGASLGWGLGYMAEPRGRSQWPQCRQPDLGRVAQHPLLARSGEASNGADHDPDSPLCRPSSAGAL